MNSISPHLIENKIKQIPAFELSYETVASHKKVYDEEQIGIFIPRSKKYLVWFTYVEEHDVAILIELGRDKKPTQCKIMTGLQFDPNGPELAQGTLFYGSLYYQSETRIYFVIEDLILYKSISVRKLCYGERLGILEGIFDRGEILSNFTGDQDSEFIQYAFTFPVAYDGNRDPTEADFARVPYPVHHIQYRLFDKIVPYVNVLIQSRTGSIVHRNFHDASEMRPSAAPSQNRPVPRAIQPPKYQREPKGKEHDVFMVRADIQSDMYILTHPRSLYEPDYAYIPNYRVSVFMNSLFRNIKENRNLDYMEDSDDDEDLMDLRPDKYVNLGREYRMECMYHKKFRRWIPLKVI